MFGSFLVNSPAFEYARVRLGLPLFVGLCTGLMLVVLETYSKLEDPANHWEPWEPWGVALGRVFLLGFIASLILYVLQFIGWASGARPFKHTVRFATREEQEVAELRLRDALEGMGFVFRWTHPDKGWICVLNPPGDDTRETQPNREKVVPLRVIYFKKSGPQQRPSMLKVECAELVYWDGGESNEAHLLGRRLLTELGEAA